MSTESSGGGRGYKSPSPATESCAISMSHVHFFKMEEKRLTADRYPLHFEVLGLYPIPVGEMQRWASDSEARLFKSLRFAEGFCFSCVASVHDRSRSFGGLLN